MNPLLLLYNKKTEKSYYGKNYGGKNYIIFVENIRVTEYNIKETLDVLWRIIIHEFSNNSRVCKDMEYITKTSSYLL